MLKSLIILLLGVYGSHEKKHSRVGLNNCESEDHSYMVAIVHARQTIKRGCSGTLIAPRWVLTSNNCMSYCDTPSIYLVIAGYTGRYQELEEEPDQTRSSLVAYCYKGSDAAQKVPYSIGLMELKTPIYASENVSFVNLATHLDIKSRKLADACDTADVLGYQVKKPLTCIKTEVLDQKSCPYKYSDALSCIRSMNTKENTCPIGNGGPLICNGIQYGVVFTNRTCIREKPQIIARVDYYENFIHKSITEHMAERSTCERSLCTYKIAVLFILALLFFSSIF